MRSSKPFLAGPLLGVLLTAGLLTGCTTPTPPVDAPTATTPVVVEAPDSPAPTPSPEVSEPVVVEVVVGVGDVLTEDPAELADGLKAYPLPDGTFVVVAADQPLPAPVLAVAQGEINTRIPDPGTYENGQATTSEIFDAAQSYAMLLGIQTGKKIVILFPLVGGCPTDTVGYLGWGHNSVTGSDSFECVTVPTYDAARGRVDALIAEQPNPGTFEVLVLQR